MTKAGIQVTKDTDGERAEGVGDLGVGCEAHGGEVVDNVAHEGDAEHDGHLLEFPLVDDHKAEGERWDEDEGEPFRSFSAADDVGGGVFGDAAVERGADCDAKAEKERIYNSVHHADGASDYAFGLELEGAADCKVDFSAARRLWPTCLARGSLTDDISRQDQSNRTLRQRREAKKFSITYRSKSAGKETGKDGSGDLKNVGVQL